MNASIWVALISACVSVFTSLATVFGAPALQRRRDGKALLSRYRDPLTAASNELQRRLHNILQQGFVETYVRGASPERREAAIETTMYVIAQYFAWNEIIRREILYLEFAEDDETAEVASSSIGSPAPSPPTTTGSNS
ncbi:hypothetical protein NONO_c25290 [Nocardia nova SH22a]|uniref:Uncharacterized protein n=1 Tax=Nocardia nova SH22a TaxID=1415166 RepID=W5TDS7_9NOCA|nr:hypothetical protein [Nocardia nova]AHH17324.1 hypothetical protein NONO_c25290 [Nocardia nova SH22a]